MIEGVYSCQSRTSPGSGLPLPHLVEAVLPPPARVEGLHDLIVQALRVVDSAELLTVLTSVPFGVDVSERNRSGDLAWKNVPVELHALLEVKQAATVFAEALIQYGVRNVEGWFPARRITRAFAFPTPMPRGFFLDELQLIVDWVGRIYEAFQGRETRLLFGVDHEYGFAVWNGVVVDFYAVIVPWKNDVIGRLDERADVLRRLVVRAA